ncbi:MAG TPA: cation:proton antiporter [Actinopolymorphaceae bacterium]|jgi:Kef-type K+ transport system membrane component KefB
MSFAALALIALVALLGPLVAVPRAWNLPIVLGELAAGVVLGRTGFAILHAADPTFTFLADIGFALVMFIAGSHVPVRDASLRKALPAGVLRAAGVGVVATGLAVGLSRAFGTGHAPLYAVLMASSSAALILPIVDSLRLGGRPVVRLLPQIAVADTACIVALPLVIDPAKAGHAALGALAMIVAGVILFVVFRAVEKNGLRRRLHRLSEAREFALELRISLIVLFALAALAVAGGVSIMLAGFTIGLVVAAVGEPRRLAKQLFALAEGFLAPLFFVWLGASLNLRELGARPSFILLGLALGVGAAIAHVVMVVTRQPASLGLLAGAQLGVPVAAATIGSQLHVLAAGEASAMMLGAIVAIALAVAGGSVAVRAGLLAPAQAGG